ncbi:MAG: 3-phosphoshikimate 1-carboxyvinyltransferase [Prevotellaceae bacterium]|nr:3-phosphoshikimate 1-carboxyvinyltransferase [Prevotellaceae bacterium]
MNRIRISTPKRLRADIKLPASKSISNRALILAALSGGGARVKNVSDCDDTRVMVSALKGRHEVIDIMAAGTAMRFLTAYLSVTDGSCLITGTERMRHRPIGVLVDALRQLGAKVEYAGEEGFPPLHITGGRLRGGRLSLPGDVSSQYTSALLMIGPLLQGGLRLTLTGHIVSRPYIDMTLSLMREFGARARWKGEDEIEVEATPYTPPASYTVENDWSAASYWYEMVALSRDPGAEVTLPGLRRGSVQGDSRVAEFFSPLGVETEFTANGVTLRKSSRQVERLELDLAGQPDLAQTLVATCAAAGVAFRLTGLQSLKIKETDRMAALRQELAKLGFVIDEEGGDTLLWKGERREKEELPAIDTYDDHRMAMALAPCCMTCGELVINNPQVVSKSYPDYWADLERASFGIVKP